MDKQLYDKIFVRMDELGAIRKDLSFVWELISNNWNPATYIKLRPNPINRSKDMHDLHYTNGTSAMAYIEDYEIIGHPPVLSDCIIGYKMSVMAISQKKLLEFVRMWNGKSYLIEQSDELGEKFYSLIK